MEQNYKRKRTEKAELAHQCCVNSFFFFSFTFELFLSYLEVQKCIPRTYFATAKWRYLDNSTCDEDEQVWWNLVEKYDIDADYDLQLHEVIYF